MDIDIRGLASDAVLVPELNTIVSQVMQIVQNTKRSKHNTARLQYLARLIVECLIRIAEGMQGKWENTPSRMAHKLADFETIIQDFSDVMIAHNSKKLFRLPLPSQYTLNEPALTDVERRLGAVVEGLQLHVRGPSSLHESPALLRSPQAHGSPGDGSVTPSVGVNVRILSFGGDGVRVISSLRILQDLMERVRHLKELNGSHVPTPLRPCDYFDLIVGTGTGAICAIFLGRLEMTAGEAIKEFLELTRAASHSASNPFRPHSAPYDTEKLTEHLEKTVRSRLGYAFVPMSNPKGCRTVVLAVTSKYINAPPALFRSYDTHSDSSSRFTIVGVASAACASDSAPVLLGDPSVSYISAAPFGHNNPTILALDEAEKIWDPKDVGLVLYIGSGTRSVVKADGSKNSIAAAHKDIASGSGDPIHDMLYGKSRNAHYIYHRLQVDRGLEHIAPSYWRINSELTETLMGVTDGYLRFKETQAKLWACARVTYGRPLPAGVTQMIFHPENKIHTQIGNMNGDATTVERGGIDIENNGIVTYTRDDIILGHELDFGSFVAMDAVFHEAVRLRDNRKVLIRRYKGAPSDSTTAKFLQDLKIHTKTWHPVIPQFIGMSKSTETPPFQVYHAPIGHCYGFFHWLWDTWDMNPGDIFRGLYDMRTSLKALDKFKREHGFAFEDNFELFSKCIVDVQYHGAETNWNLIYTGDMSPDSQNDSEDIEASVFGAYLKLSRPLTLGKRAPSSVSAFSGNFQEWVNARRPLEKRELEPVGITTLFEMILENGWLGESSMVIPSNREKIRLGDVGYFRGASDDITFVSNLHDEILESFGTEVAFRRSGPGPEDEDAGQVIVEGQSGRSYDRTECQFQPDDRIQHSDSVTCHVPAQLTLQYCDKASPDVRISSHKRRHLWRVLQKNASKISAENGIPPHELIIVTSVEINAVFYVERDVDDLDTESISTEDSETDDASSTEEPPIVYVFKGSVEKIGKSRRGSSAPTVAPMLAASFDPEPEWLDNDRDWCETRTEAGINDWTLTCCPPHTSISYLQLPIGAALPYITEVETQEKISS